MYMYAHVSFIGRNRVRASPPTPGWYRRAAATVVDPYTLTPVPCVDALRSRMSAGLRGALEAQAGDPRSPVLLYHLLDGKLTTRDHARRPARGHQERRAAAAQQVLQSGQLYSQLRRCTVSPPRWVIPYIDPVSCVCAARMILKLL